ncbi:GDPGP1 family protein [Megaselia abdita]
MDHGMDSYLENLKDKWEDVHNKGGVFAYKLDVTTSKTLKGNYGFYCELNVERTTKRRIPQQIPLENTTFDPSKFNFTKIKPEEVLSEIPFKDSTVTFVINSSPLTKYHCLIVPDLDKCYPQILNKVSIGFTIRFLLNISDNSFKIGYNSPGALASVNHLHLHLIHLNQNTFIENIKLVKLKTDLEFYKSAHEHIRFVCFKVDTVNFEKNVDEFYKLIKWMIDSLIPHNLYFLKESTFVKIFVFAKKEAIAVKTLGQVNLAFCELIGYVPVGDEEVFDGLDEDSLVSSFRDASGDIYDKIYNFIEK